MKLLLSFIYLILFIFNNTLSDYIYITPYDNSCNDRDIVGVGYQFPLNQCITLSDDSFALFSINNNQLIVSWLENCELPIKNSSIEYTYTLNICSFFKLPNETSILSLISTSNIDIPINSIVFDYYYQHNNICSGSIYRKYITNSFKYNDIKYTCNNNIPYTFYCNETGKCSSNKLSNDCSNSYPFTVTCYR